MPIFMLGPAEQCAPLVAGIPDVHDLGLESDVLTEITECRVRYA
jgi:hypothetical protein